MRGNKWRAMHARKMFPTQPKATPCPNCNGYGEVTAGDPDIGQPEYPLPCAKCEGTGFVRSSANVEAVTREEQATHELAGCCAMGLCGAEATRKVRERSQTQ